MEAREQAEAVELGHAKITDEHVEARGGDAGQRRLAVGRLLDLEPRVFEHASQRAAHTGVVLGDQDTRAHGGTSDTLPRRVPPLASRTCREPSPVTPHVARGMNVGCARATPSAWSVRNNITCPQSRHAQPFHASRMPWEKTPPLGVSYIK